MIFVIEAGYGTKTCTLALIAHCCSYVPIYLSGVFTPLIFPALCLEA